MTKIKRLALMMLIAVAGITFNGSSRERYGCLNVWETDGGEVDYAWNLGRTQHRIDYIRLLVTYESNVASRHPNMIQYVRDTLIANFNLISPYSQITLAGLVQRTYGGGFYSEILPDGTLREAVGADIVIHLHGQDYRENTGYRYIELVKDSYAHDRDYGSVFVGDFYYALGELHQNQNDFIGYYARGGFVNHAYANGEVLDGRYEHCVQPTEREKQYYNIGTIMAEYNAEARLNAFSGYGVRFSKCGSPEFTWADSLNFTKQLFATHDYIADAVCTQGTVTVTDSIFSRDTADIRALTKVTLGNGCVIASGAKVTIKVGTKHPDMVEDGLSDHWALNKQKQPGEGKSEPSVAAIPKSMSLAALSNQRALQLNYALTQSSAVSLRVFDILGKLVYQREHAEKSAGFYTESLPSSINTNKALIIQMRAEGKTLNIKYIGR